MILRPQQIVMMRLGLPVTPANIGGPDIRNQGGATTNNTTTNDTRIDNSTSVMNTSNITTTTDGGAFDLVKNIGNESINLLNSLGVKLIDGVTSNEVHAYDYADSIFDKTIDFANQNDSRALDAFARAATITQDALTTAKGAYAGASAQMQSAYADAKGTTASQEKIMLAVLAVAAVAVFAVMSRKG